MLHGDCAQAFCVDLDNNTDFQDQPALGSRYVWRWENGTISGDGDNVSDVLRVPETLNLYLTKVNQNIQTNFVGSAPTFTTSPLHYAELNYDADSCSWIGLMIHPTNGAANTNEPDMFIQLFAYNDSEDENLFRLFGKIWGDEWDVEHWLRITAQYHSVEEIGYWQNQIRWLKENEDGVCEWFPHGAAEMPTWMQSLPSAYTVSVSNTDDGCECGDVSYSGTLISQGGGVDNRLRFCEDNGFYFLDFARDEDLPEDSCVRGVYLHFGNNNLMLSMHFGKIVGGTYGQIGWSDRFHIYEDGDWTDVIFPDAVRNPFGESLVYHASTATHEPDLSPECITPAPSVTITPIW